MGEVIKARKPKARDTQVVIGAIEANIEILASLNQSNEWAVGRIARLTELMDELSRSLNRKENGDE